MSSAIPISPVADCVGAAAVAGGMVGPYRTTRVIASGGMGVIYEALQERPHRKVAVKVMRAGLDSPGLRLRFEREAEILASLRHPGIAQIHGAGLHANAGGDVPYFVMELIDG